MEVCVETLDAPREGVNSFAAGLKDEAGSSTSFFFARASFRRAISSALWLFVATRSFSVSSFFARVSFRPAISLALCVMAMTRSFSFFCFSAKSFFRSANSTRLVSFAARILLSSLISPAAFAFAISTFRIVAFSALFSAMAFAFSIFSAMVASRSASCFTQYLHCTSSWGRCTRQRWGIVGVQGVLSMLGQYGVPGKP